MSAVRIVFLHEWTSLHRRGVLVLMSVIIGAVGVLTVIGAHRDWRLETAERQALQSRETAQWLALDDAHIHKAAHRGYFVVRDLPPGAILDRGVWDFGGSTIWLEAHRRNAPQLRAADARAFIARGAPHGLGPVLLWLTPLLMAVLMHGVVARERASGGLAFAVSAGAPAAAVVFGKTLAVAAASALAAAVPMLIGVAVAMGAGLGVAAAAGWGLLVLGALGVFSVIVVTVSSHARRPLGALVALLLIWFAAAILWPRLAAGLTNVAASAPSSQTVRSAAEVAAEGLVSDETEQAVLARFAADGLNAPNLSGVSAMAAEIDAASAFAGIFAPLEDGMKRQALVLDVLSWASPLTAADRQADAVFGLGDRDQFAFEARAEAMRFETQMALNDAWARAPAVGRGGPHVWASVVDAAQAAAAEGPARAVAGVGLLVWLAVSAGLLRSAVEAVRDGAQ